MRIDLLRPSAWEESNEAVQNIVGAPASTGIRVTKGLASGVFETLNATASFMSHKRILGVIEGQSWAQIPALAPLLRDNFEIKTFSAGSFTNPEGVIESLGGETSCFFMPEDHPVTAEKFDIEALDQALNAKRINAIRVSHHGSLRMQTELRPYSVRLCSVSADLAIAFTGARYRTPIQMAPWQSWNPEDVARETRACVDHFHEDQKTVADFESKLSASFQAVLKTQNRVWDRAVVTSLEKSGEQILADLEKATGQKMLAPGLSTWGETSQLCRWNATLQDLSWWKTELSPDQIRGLIVLSIETIQNPHVQQYFSSRR